ncbi:alpha/beta fold hydrolase [Tenacibaculum ascidiaceicola]|uniref:alpha/beta fold hydrolase n=1 Tax=Tenacibaculum ascidiaceicola TaxID=1699411 RepID=UPI0039E99154
MKLNVDKINIEIVGNGKPTLFIHGVPDSSEVWRNLVNELKDTRRCYMIDLPGFGNSGIPKDFEFSFDYYSQLIDKIIIRLNIKEQIDLFVHDVGGFYGFSWAINFPRKVREIYVFNTAYTSEFKWHFLAKAYQKPLLGELLTYFLSKKRFVKLIKKASPLLNYSVAELMFDKLKMSGRKMMMNYYRRTSESLFEGNDVRLKRLSKTVRISVFWGDKDIFINKNIAETFFAHKVTHYKEYGHWLLVSGYKEIAKDIYRN